MKEGAAIESILFFRYAIAVLFLGGFLLLSRQSFKISWKQAGVLLILGLLYTSSSVFLFEAYNYITSGLATTIIFLYPVLVAIIMVFLRVVPSWPVWLSIILAAEHPEIIEKLILIGCPPFEEKYVPLINDNRLKRLKHEKKERFMYLLCKIMHTSYCPRSSVY